MKRLLSREEAFTGLEAAIVLIAFVVVAAVFAYVVLGAGFFTTQKSQEVVHQGVQQASSSIEILGNVYGLDLTGDAASAGAGNQIDYLNFTIGLAPGGMPIDMTKVTMVYSNQTTRVELNEATPFNTNSAPPSGNWSIAKITNGNTNSYLEAGEQFDVVVHLVENTGSIAPRDQFTLEVKPIIGPSLSITRTAPGGINLVNSLY
jgi:flagellin FlaB